jgi:methyltransferase (TIGR00027 family)
MTVPRSLAGVGLTAVGAAIIRARETGRPDRMIADPYAQLFADAAEADFLGPTAPDGAERSWARMLDLVERFHDGRVVATRFFDEFLVTAVEAGCVQVVNVGAGLDTRAFRLPLPPQVVCFELDQPAMVAFKERVLRDHLGRPTSAARRVVVPTDLRGTWLADLTAAGFDRSLPTAWLEEGVLAYLPPDDATTVLDTITEITTSGSRLAKAAMSPPREDDETYRRMRAFVGGSGTPTAGVTGVDRDNAYRLGERGWRVTAQTHVDLAARYGRPVGDMTRAAGSGVYISAVRERRPPVCYRSVLRKD